MDSTASPPKFFLVSPCLFTNSLIQKVIWGVPTTTGPHRLSAELVSLVCFEWRSYYLPVSFMLVLEEPGKNQFHSTFLQTPQFCKPLITFPLCHVFFQLRFLAIQWMGFLACCHSNHSISLTILGHLWIISVLEHPVIDKWTRILDFYSSIWTWTDLNKTNISGQFFIFFCSLFNILIIPNFFFSPWITTTMWYFHGTGYGNAKILFLKTFGSA